MLFVLKQEDSHASPNEFSSENFLHSILAHLQNEHICNELRLLEDKKPLEHLTSDMTDQNERQQKFSNTLKKTALYEH